MACLVGPSFQEGRGSEAATAEVVRAIRQMDQHRIQKVKIFRWRCLAVCRFNTSSSRFRGGRGPQVRGLSGPGWGTASTVFYRKEATVKVADKRAGGAAGRPVESAIRLFFYVITIGYSIWERIKISVPLKLFMCFATDAL